MLAVSFLGSLCRAQVVLPDETIVVAQMAASFFEFPPRQDAASFGITDALNKLRAGLPSA